MIETGSFDYQNKPRELVSSNGFAVEYDSRVTDQELRDDIISYLGEYRFALNKYDYELEFSDGAVRDARRGEPMSVKAARSVRERMMRGESINREAAEAIGLNFLDQQLETAETGDSIVWASPPGAVSDGYGDYGFFYVGQIKRSIENKKEIQMSALRVEKPTIDKYKTAFKTLTDIDYEVRTPEDYLKFPVVIKKELSDEFVTKTLGDNFPFRMDSKQQEIFDIAMERMTPQIDEFISMMRWATKDEKKKAFHALENYSLQIKKELESGEVSVFQAERKFADLVKAYGFEPPKVAGSCPIKSNNPFVQGFESLVGALEQEWFTCPKKSCGYKASGPVGDTCPGCGLTKEEYAKSGAAICD